MRNFIHQQLVTYKKEKKVKKVKTKRKYWLDLILNKYIQFIVKTAVPKGKFKRCLGFLLERASEFGRHVKWGLRTWRSALTTATASACHLTLLSAVHGWHDVMSDIDRAGSASFINTMSTHNQYTLLATGRLTCNGSGTKCGRYTIIEKFVRRVEWQTLYKYMIKT